MDEKTDSTATQEPSLDELCKAWLKAKANEAAENAKRVTIEAQIIALTGKPDEGSKTEKTSAFKIKLTGKMTRKFDMTAWPLVRDKIPQEMWPLKQKTELDETGVKWLKEHQPEFYKLLPLTVTPAKTSIEVVPLVAAD